MTEDLLFNTLNPDISDLLAHATREREKQHRQVIADAASGHGPQPWERDWPLGKFDLAEHLSSPDFNPDEAMLGHLLTMIRWALDSPLGRQALMADGATSNPGQHTLDTLRVLRSSLVARRRELLAARLDDTESWVQRCSLGGFNLFEHIATCKAFKPDWFTTGELLEIADWALSSDHARQVSWDEPYEMTKTKEVLAVIGHYGEGLGLHRRRLLMEQAELSLGYGPDSLAALRRSLEP